jgi:hypothetical protein
MLSNYHYYYAFFTVLPGLLKNYALNPFIVKKFIDGKNASFFFNTCSFRHLIVQSINYLSTNDQVLFEKSFRPRNFS